MFHQGLLNLTKLCRSLLNCPALHAWLAIVWVLLIIPTVLWWKDSILWVLIISIYANIVGHWGSYQAVRAEKAAKTCD